MNNSTIWWVILIVVVVLGAYFLFVNREPVEAPEGEIPYPEVTQPSSPTPESLPPGAVIPPAPVLPPGPEGAAPLPAQ